MTHEQIINDILDMHYANEGMAALVSLLRDRLAEMERLPDGWRIFRLENGRFAIEHDTEGSLFDLRDYEDDSSGTDYVDSFPTLAAAIEAAEEIRRGEVT